MFILLTGMRIIFSRTSIRCSTVVPYIIVLMIGTEKYDVEDVWQQKNNLACRKIYPGTGNCRWNQTASICFSRAGTIVGTVGLIPVTTYGTGANLVLDREK